MAVPRHGPRDDDYRNLPKPLPSQGQGGQAVKSGQGIVAENEIGGKGIQDLEVGRFVLRPIGR